MLVVSESLQLLYHSFGVGLVLLIGPTRPSNKDLGKLFHADFSSFFFSKFYLVPIYTK